MKRFATLAVLGIACSGSAGCEIGFHWGVNGANGPSAMTSSPSPDPSSTPPSQTPPSNGPVGHWSPVASWATARNDTIALWTGQQVILFGGSAAPSSLDPSTGAMAPLRDASALTGTDPMATMMDDRDVIAWRAGSGGRYDVVAEMSLGIATQGSPGPRYGASSVWTGHDMMVWGGADAQGSVEGGALYDPRADRWTPVSATNAPVPRAFHTATAMNDDVLIFGGERAGHVPLGDGAVYRSALDGWLQLPTDGEPSARTHHTAVWTGHEVIVWGGRGADGPTLGDGAAFDPNDWTWRPVSLRNAPSARAQHVALWTDHGMLVWGGVAADGHALADGALYDPSTDTWTTIDSAQAPSSRADALAVWTGHDVVVVGGHDGPDARADAVRLSF